MAIVDPTDISTLGCWLDPTSLSLAQGADLTTWTDSSSNSNNLTVTTTAFTYDAGTQWWKTAPSVRNTSSSGRMEIAADSSMWGAAVTIMFAINTDQVETDNVWFYNGTADSGSTTSTHALRFNDGRFNAIMREEGDTGNNIQATSNTPVQSGWSIVAVTYDSTGVTVYHNNQQVAFTAASAGSGAVVTNMSEFYMFNHPTSNLGYGGYMGDFMIFKSTLSASQLTDVHDWLRLRYPVSEFTRTGIEVVTARDVGIDYDDAQDRYAKVVVFDTTNAIGLYLSEVGDPHNWTFQGGLVQEPDNPRAIDLLRHEGTWYMYVDDPSTANNGIYGYSGTTFSNLAAMNSGSAILTGTGSTTAGNDVFVRAPSVVHDGTQFHMFYDGRRDGPTGTLGAVHRAVSTNGTTWTKVAGEAVSPATSGEGYYADDVTHPSIMKEKIDGEWILAFSGYNDDHMWRVQSNTNLGRTHFNHQIGLARSTNLTTWSVDAYPILQMGPSTTDFDATHVSQPKLFRPLQGPLSCYYTGQDINAVSGTNKVSYALADNFLGVATADGEGAELRWEGDRPSWTFGTDG